MYHTHLRHLNPGDPTVNVEYLRIVVILIKDGDVDDGGIAEEWLGAPVASHNKQYIAAT